MAVALPRTNGKKKRVTIKEIARAAGVSTQTVSRVLNDRPDVSFETRHRIQKLIEQFDYQPSQLARGLIRGRTNTIGIVSSDLQHFGPSQTLTGIANQAQALGYSLSIHLVNLTDDLEVDVLLQSMLAQHVDGIIWAAVEKDAEIDRSMMDRLLSLEVPFVANRTPQAGLPGVYTDNRVGGKLATRHLLDQGYRKIGHISGPLDEWSSQQRMAGWRAELEAAGHHAGKSMIAEGDWTPESGARALKKLFEQHPDLDAVFCANDQMALGVLYEAVLQGRCVPGDLGVVGFDDFPEARFFSPPLSTVRQDLIENGMLLVRELDRAIQAYYQGEPYEPQSIVIAPKLVCRNSSAAFADWGSTGGDY